MRAAQAGASRPVISLDRAGQAGPDGYHTGLLVTILLLAGGVEASYVTLRPEPGGMHLGQSAAVAELAAFDEVAGQLMVADECRGMIGPDGGLARS